MTVEYERDLTTVEVDADRAAEVTPELIAALEGLGYQSWTTASEKKTKPAH